MNGIHDVAYEMTREAQVANIFIGGLHRRGLKWRLADSARSMTRGLRRCIAAGSCRLQ